MAPGALGLGQAAVRTGLGSADRPQSCDVVHPSCWARACYSWRRSSSVEGAVLVQPPLAKLT